MKRRVGLGFAALCLLSGSGWLLDEWRTAMLPGLLGLSVHDGLLALGFGAASLRWRSKAGVAWRVWMKVAGWGGVTFAVPPVLFAAAGGHVSSFTGVLIFGLVPVVVIFVVAQGTNAFGAGESPLRMLGPALAGLGGAALLVPFEWPSSGSGALWLAALVLAAALVGVAAVRLHRLLAGVGVLQGAALICAVVSVVGGAFCGIGWTGVSGSAAGAGVEAARCVLFEGPVMLLTVWLLREMRPVGFSSRYLLVPLVTIAEGFVLMRPAGNWSMAAGFVLLAGGGAGLLMADSGELQEEL